jgi:hypothetical protein
MPVTHYIDNMKIEQLSDLKTVRYEPDILTVSNTITSLTLSSSYVHIFIGTTVGQRINLPNATTLQTGHSFRFWNKSSTEVDIRNVAGVSLTVIQPDDKVESTVRDVSTTNGIWLFERTAAAALALVQSQRTTNATFDTSWADVTIDTTDYESEAAVLEHNDSNRARFDVKESGYYQLSYQFTAVETGGARLNSRLYKNNSVVVLGSDRFMEVGTDVLNAVCITQFNAGDYFTLQILRTGGTTGTGYANIVVYALKLGGSKGEKGEPGSGSTITLKDNGALVTNTPHETINFDGGLDVVDDGAGQATVFIIFGRWIAQNESTGLSTTTSTTYQQKLRLTTGAIEAGTYRIGWMYDWGMTSNSYNFDAQVQVDTTTLMNHVEEPQDASTAQRHQVSGFAYVTLTAATHNVDLDYRSSNASGTARIQNARLEIWRVS